MKQKTLLKTMLLLCALVAGSGTMWGDPVTVSMTSFDAISGNVDNDANISYAAAKGAAATAPAVNNNEIRVYQNGGTFTVSANNGATINSITLGSSMATTVTYSVDGGTASSDQSISANGTITVNNLSCSSVLFTCKGTSKSSRLYVNSLSVTYTPAAPAYTITAESNNTEYGTVYLSGSVITGSPKSGFRYADPAYSVSPANSATVEQNGDEFTVTPSANTTVTINFEAIPTYTVTLGDDNSTLTETSGGAGVTLPTRSDVGDYTFAGWSTTNMPTETTDKPGIIAAGEYHPTASVTLYPVYTRTEGVAEETLVETMSYPDTNWNLSSENTFSATGGYTVFGEGGYVESTNTVDLSALSKVIVTARTYGGTSNEYFNVGTATAVWKEGDATGGTTMKDYTLEEGASLTGTAKIRVTSSSGNGSSTGVGISKVEIYISGTTYYISTPPSSEKQDNSILYVADSYDLDIADVGGELNLSGAAASHGTLQSEIVTANTTVDASKYTWNGSKLTVSEGGNGIIVIRFWVDADAEYNAVEQIATVTVIADPVNAYDGETDDTDYGTPYTIDADFIEGGAITEVSSSNTNVATVDGLVITPKAVGTTTITIKTAATAIWHAGTATFTLNVTAPEGKTTAAAEIITTTFTDKNLNYEDGGIDWTASTDANSFESANDARGVQFGAGIGEFTLTATGSNVTKVSMVVSTNDSGNSIEVSVGGNPFLTTYGVDEGSDFLAYLKSGMKNETVEFIGEAGNSVIISVYDAAKSVYFKSITLYTDITATLNASGYATLCSEYPLDFTSASGYSAWQITEANSTTGVITFSQITGSVKGGTGILLKGDADDTVTLTSVNSTNELGDNLLVGTLAPTIVAANEYYGLSGDTFKKVNAGTVPAGKALLPASVVDGTNARLTFVFEGTQGISEVEHTALSSDDAVYSISGQRVSTPKKGLYIMNGKKVVMK